MPQVRFTLSRRRCAWTRAPSASCSTRCSRWRGRPGARTTSTPPPRALTEDPTAAGAGRPAALLRARAHVPAPHGRRVRRALPQGGLAAAARAGQVRGPARRAAARGRSRSSTRACTGASTRTCRSSEALLDVLYPQHVRPVPSMSLVELELDPELGKLPGGFRVPRGSELRSRPVQGMPCRFRTCYDTTLWPAGGGRRRVDGADRAGGGVRLGDAVGAVRASSSCARCGRRDASGAGDPGTLDALRLHLAGEASVADTLYELLLNSCLRVVVRDPDQPSRAPVVLPGGACAPVGFEDDEALLPLPAARLRGLRAAAGAVRASRRSSTSSTSPGSAAALRALDCGRARGAVFVIAPFERAERRPGARARALGARGAARVHAGGQPVPQTPSRSCSPSGSSSTSWCPTRGAGSRSRRGRSTRCPASRPAWRRAARRSSRSTPSATGARRRGRRVLARGAARQRLAHRPRHRRVDLVRRPLGARARARRRGGVAARSPASTATCRAGCRSAPTSAATSSWRRAGRCAHALPREADAGRAAAARQAAALAARLDALAQPPVAGGGGARGAARAAAAAQRRRLGRRRAADPGARGVRSAPAFARVAGRRGSRSRAAGASSSSSTRSSSRAAALFLFASVLERFLALYASMNSFTQLARAARQRKRVVREWAPRAGCRTLV
jgi:type VI secretion system protein ImpG